MARVYAALPTPFDEKKAIDAKALDHLTDYLLGAPVGGLALLTEAAEDALLLPDERKLVIKTVGARLKGKKPFLVQVSAASTQEALDLAKAVESRGGEGVLLATPRVPGFGYRELYRHLDAVIKGTALPVMLLVRPGNALDALLPEEIGTLAAHKGLKGVLAPHASPAVIEEWSKRLKDREGRVMGGCSFAQSKASAAGAAGFVCALAALGPEQASKLGAAIEKGNKSAAAEMEGKMAPVVELLGPPAVRPEGRDGVEKLATKIARRSLDSPTLQPSYPFALLKEALKLQGHPVRTDVRPPYERAKPDGVDRLKATLGIAGLLP